MAQAQTPRAAPASFAVSLVMFDLDGTLLDTAPDLADAVNNMLQELGHERAPRTEVIGWVGHGMAYLVGRALEVALGAAPDAVLLERALAIFKRHYTHNLTVCTRPYPGMVDVLEDLHTRGFALACVTNKPAMFTEPLLAQLGLTRYFSLTISGDSLPARKPDPLPLLHTCRHFNVTPAQALLVGDSAVDIDAARAAGVPVIAVSYGYNHGRNVRELSPDGVVDSPIDLLQYLRLWTA